MSDKTTFIYWDSDVFLSYINQNPERFATLEAILAQIQESGGRTKILTSVLARIEVAFVASEKELGILSSEAEAQIDAIFTDTNVVELVEVHNDIVVRARRLIREAVTRGWSLKPNDAVHLASAEWAEAREVHTYESKWKRYAEIIGRDICEPYIEQARLPNI
jgi:predicted nucleic acid-binding protein